MRLHPGKYRGFTLMELMIVLAIISILAAISYPSYRSHVQKTRRVEAEGALMGMSNAMVRWYTENNTYCDAGGTGGANGCGGSTNDTGKPTALGYPETSPSTGTVYYDLTISAATATAYTLSATPRGGSPQADDPCNTLTLTSAGAKGQSGGTWTTTAKCW